MYNLTIHLDERPVEFLWRVVCFRMLRGSLHPRVFVEVLLMGTWLVQFHPVAGFRIATATWWCVRVCRGVWECWDSGFFSFRGCHTIPKGYSESQFLSFNFSGCDSTLELGRAQSPWVIFEELLYFTCCEPMAGAPSSVRWGAL